MVIPGLYGKAGLPESIQSNTAMGTSEQTEQTRASFLYDYGIQALDNDRPGRLRFCIEELFEELPRDPDAAYFLYLLLERVRAYSQLLWQIRLEEEATGYVQQLCQMHLSCALAFVDI